MKKFGTPLLTPKQLEQYQKNFEQKAAVNKQSKKQEYESNAEVQRWRSRSKGDNARDAVDLMTGQIKKYNDFKAGKDTGEKAAREKAIQLAERADRDKR